MSKIWHLLNIDSLTNSCGFGLEYYLLGNTEKAKPLLMEGVQFCDMIEKGNIAMTKEIIDMSYLEAWEDLQIIISYKNSRELKAIIEESAKIKGDLLRMINDNVIFPECKIRNMQSFFIEGGKPYLSKAYRLLRALEKRY